MTVTPSQRPPATISVITVSYETGPALMESIRATLKDRDVSELILVDNGNSRATRKRLAGMIGQTERLRLLQGHGNIGFARACNYGARQAQGDYFLFLNPDAVMAPGAARKLAEAGAGRNHPWITGGRLLNADGAEQRGGRRGPLTFWSAITSFTPLHRLPGLTSIHWEHQPLPEGPVDIPTVSGACLLMPRDTFEQLGGFDPAYFLHVEDIAICRDVRAAGGSVIFVPGAEAMHYGSTSNASRMTVEWHKLKGFLHYFWTSGGIGAKIGTAVGAPLMAVAILGRASWLSLKKAFRGN